MVVGSRGAARLRKVVGGSYVRPDDAAHAKSNDRQPTAQMLLEAIEAIDARDARIAELAAALRDVLDLSDTRKRRELAEIKEIIAKARSALAAPDPGAEPVINRQ